MCAISAVCRSSPEMHKECAGEAGRMPDQGVCKGRLVREQGQPPDESMISAPSPPPASAQMHAATRTGTPLSKVRELHFCVCSMVVQNAGLETKPGMVDTCAGSLGSAGLGHRLAMSGMAWHCTVQRTYLGTPSTLHASTFHIGGYTGQELEDVEGHAMT